MRAPCCDKSKVKKGAWSAEEDLRLTSFIHTHGHPNWRSLPYQAGLLRCGKSCRLRWINYLRPDVKRGNFTPQEEGAIIKLHHSLGNKWSKIASHFPGRTDNEIKNVWNTHFKKRLVAKDAARCERRETSSLIRSTFFSSTTTTTTTTFKSLGDQNEEKGYEDGGEYSVVTKKSREKHGHNNVFLAGQPSCCSSSSSISSHASINTCNYYDDSSSRPRVGGEESIGEVVVNDDDDDDDLVAAIDEVPLECDTDFWDMLHNLEFEDQTADDNDREVECKKWMRYLENELQLGPTTTTTGTLHEEEEEEEDKVHNINNTKPQLEEDDDDDDDDGVELAESIN